MRTFLYHLHFGKARSPLSRSHSTVLERTYVRKRTRGERREAGGRGPGRRASRLKLYDSKYRKHRKYIRKDRRFCNCLLSLVSRPFCSSVRTVPTLKEKRGRQPGHKCVGPYLYTLPTKLGLPIYIFINTAREERMEHQYVTAYVFIF